MYLRVGLGDFVLVLSRLSFFVISPAVMDLAFERLSSLNVSAATPVLLLAHGNGFCRQTWYAVLDELRCLAASGSRKGNVNGDLSFRAVLCDMRSHGDSPSANGRVGWEEQARDMNRIAKVVRKNVGRHVPIVAVGHSMGATALLLAELSNPGTFQAAVVAEPVSIPQNIVEVLSKLFHVVFTLFPSLSLFLTLRTSKLLCHVSPPLGIIAVR